MPSKSTSKALDKTPPTGYRGIGLGCILFLWLAVAGCTRTSVSWDSPHVRSIEREWAEFGRRLTVNGKWRADAEQRALIAMMRTHLQPYQLEQLVSSCHELPSERDKMTRFQSAALVALLCILADDGQRATLVRLLAQRCPRTFSSIEFSLVAGDGHIRDPILILTDAFEASADRGAKGDIVAALARAFPHLVREGMDEAQFVHKCVSWYKEHRRELRLNPDYGKGPVFRDGAWHIDGLFLRGKETDQ